VKLETRDDAPAKPGAAPGSGGYILTGNAESCPVEILIDADQRIRRGKCVCGHYRKFGLKNGPCRHMLALRWAASATALEAYRASAWHDQLRGRGS